MTRAIRGASLPGWLFAVFVAVAGPLIVFRLGAYHWFLRDDWVLLADRGDGPLSKLFEPVGGSHWTAVPRLVYGALWPAVGLTTYRPYQIVVVALHLAVVVQLRVVMRRAGVRPWLASAAAALLVLFGPGAQDIVWAFQIGFTGSVAFGLAQLLLCDHDGPSDRRDALGLGFGLLAVMSSGVGTTTTVVVALAVLLRRGWRPALLCSVPLLVVYGVWALAAGAEVTGAFGRPAAGVLLSWVWSAALGTILGLSRFTVLAWLHVVLLVGGLTLLWRAPDRRARWRELAAPVALAAGAATFAVTTGLSRWWLGAEGARASRYVYLGAALVLPLLAVAAEAVARRWTRLVPVLVVVLLLPIPFNLDGFGGGLLGKDYMDRQRYVLTTVVRMPFARDVPRDVQPAPDPYASEAVTIGFLLTAASNGDLTPSTVPLTEEVVNEFRVRLGVAQRSGSALPPAGCASSTTPVELTPDKGEVLHLGSRVSIATITTDGRRSSRPVIFDPSSGSELTIELPDLRLRIGPATGAPSYRLCPRG